ncbi:MAG: hypothetical protein QP780_00055 [Brevibacterium sp. UMB1308B]|nr:hypothetical protein [Brevibacterium sp. UMB1308B]
MSWASAFGAEAVTGVAGVAAIQAVLVAVRAELGTAVWVGERVERAAVDLLGAGMPPGVVALLTA